MKNWRGEGSDGVMERWSSERKGNIEHQTPNAERRTFAATGSNFPFDVRCPMFSVRCSLRLFP